jgi:hypothetical protein
MPMTRSLLTLALAATVLLLPAAAAAQEDATAAPTVAGATPPAAGTPISELRALMPDVLDGKPFLENLQVATGEELVGVMRPEEVRIIEGLLEESDRTLAEYTAASAWLPFDDIGIVVLQAYRIAGVDAPATIDTWIEMLSINLIDPVVEAGSVAGYPVTLVSDTTAPDVPLLYLWPSGDVVWMMVTADASLVEEVMTGVGADDSVEAEAKPAT